MLEISDLIVDYDPDTLARRPVRRRDVLDALRGEGNARAARIVAALPETAGVLDAEAVDALLLRVHMELQRLSEEMQQGRRVRLILAPLLAALRATGVRPLRVVDIGCGLGYVVRWLAARGELGDDVELIGCDYNAALVRAAQAAADAEGLRCSFAVANAFRLETPATIYTSTGVLHHFRGAALEAFFRAQAAASAFVHFDLKRSWAAPIGAWMFHQTRMREALSRHDGVRSAQRTHAPSALLAAAHAGAPALAATMFDGEVGWLPIMRVMHAVVGVRDPHRDAFVRALGRDAPAGRPRVIPAVLIALAILDASLAGYRAAAGRNPLIAKRGYYRRAILRGAIAGVAASAAIAAVVGVLLATSSDGAALYADLCTAGARLAAIAGGYAAVFVGALVAFAVPSIDVRALASVLVFGPFTMVRPAFVVGAATAGALTAPRAESFVACAAAAAAVLAVEPVLARSVRIGTR